MARQYKSNHAGGRDRNADSGRHRDDLTQQPLLQTASGAYHDARRTWPRN
jgi:hypothetical protein